MMRRLGAGMMVLACGFGASVGALPGPAAANSADPPPEAPAEYAPGEILVGFEPGTPPSRVADTLARADADTEAVLGAGVRVVEGPADAVPATIEELRSLPGVRYAEPNYVARTSRTPNDPSFGELYGMTKIGAPAAWDVSTGDGSVVVGVLDTGIDGG